MGWGEHYTGHQFPTRLSWLILAHCNSLQRVAKSGERLSSECFDLINAAAKVRSREDPLPIRGHAERMWRERWLCMFNVAIQRVVAASLVREGGIRTHDAIPGTEPCSVDIWLDGQRQMRWEKAVPTYLVYPNKL